MYLLIKPWNYREDGGGGIPQQKQQKNVERLKIKCVKIGFMFAQKEPTTAENFHFPFSKSWTPSLSRKIPFRHVINPTVEKELQKKEGKHITQAHTRLEWPNLSVLRVIRLKFEAEEEGLQGRGGGGEV